MNDSEQHVITVSVIDDDPLVCQAMSMILRDYSQGRVSVVSTSTDGATAVRNADSEHPDVVLMDVAMPGIDGIETTRRLRALRNPPHVLIPHILEPVQHGGTLRGGRRRGIRIQDRRAGGHHPPHSRHMRGTPQFNPASQRQLINDLSMQRPQSRRDEARALLDTLPSREREAVLLAAEGCTNAEIAGRMFISERTAKAHLSSAADKLDMGRVQMARLVERADL